MKIYILRHEKRFGKPSFETSLTEKGSNDAKKLVGYLENIFPSNHLFLNNSTWLVKLVK